MCENKIEGGIELALWRIPVHWTVGGDAKIEAPTLEMALRTISEASFPDEDWENDLLEPDCDCDVETIRRLYNDGQADEEVTSENRILERNSEVEVISTGEICIIKDRYYDDGWRYWVESVDGKGEEYSRKEIQPVDSSKQNNLQACGLAELFWKENENEIYSGNLGAKRK